MGQSKPTNKIKGRVKRSMNVVLDAISDLQEKPGSLPSNICRYISVVYDVDAKLIKSKVRRALHRCVDAGYLSERNGLYKLRSSVKVDVLKLPTKKVCWWYRGGKRTKKAGSRSRSPKGKARRQAKRGSSRRRRAKKLKRKKPKSKKGRGKSRRRALTSKVSTSYRNMLISKTSQIEADADLILGDLIRSIERSKELQYMRSQIPQRMSCSSFHPLSSQNCSKSEFYKESSPIFDSYACIEKSSSETERDNLNFNISPSSYNEDIVKLDPDTPINDELELKKSDDQEVTP